MNVSHIRVLSRGAILHVIDDVMNIVAEEETKLLTFEIFPCIELYNAFNICLFRAIQLLVSCEIQSSDCHNYSREKQYKSIRVGYLINYYTFI